MKENQLQSCKKHKLFVSLQCVFHGIRLLRLIQKLVVVRQSIFLYALFTAKALCKKTLIFLLE